MGLRCPCLQSQGWNSYHTGMFHIERFTSSKENDLLTSDPRLLGTILRKPCCFVLVKMVLIGEVSEMLLMLQEDSVRAPDRLLPGGCLNEDLLERPQGSRVACV